MSIGPRSGRVFATGGDDCYLNLWSITEDSPILRYGAFSHPITTCKFDRSENQIFYTTSGGLVSCLDLDRNSTVYSWQLDEASPTCISLNPHFQDVIAVGDSSGRVSIFSSSTSTPLQQYYAHRGQVSSVCISPTGSLLATAGSDHLVRVIDLSTGQTLIIFRSNLETPSALAFHPIEKLLASVSSDRCVRIFDIDRNYEIKGGFVIGACPPTSISFSSDGDLLAACSPSALSVFRTQAPDFADHTRINVAQTFDLQMYSTGVAIASADGANPDLVLLRADDFRLMRKTPPHVSNPQKDSIVPSKVIDGSFLPDALQVPQRKAAPRLIAELPPKEKVVPQPPSEPNIYKFFKVDRGEYLSNLAKRFSSLSQIRDSLKASGVGQTIERGLNNSVNTVDLLRILRGHSKVYNLTNTSSVFRLINKGLNEDPLLAIAVLSEALESVGPSIALPSNSDGIVEDSAEMVENVLRSLHELFAALKEMTNLEGEVGYGAKGILSKWGDL